MMNGLDISNQILELETNPAFVPVSVDIPSVITQQPGWNGIPEEKDRSGTNHQYTRRHHNQENKPTGLASLAVAELLLIEIDLSWCHCDWSTRYSIKDVSSEESLVFNAIEELNCCHFNCGGYRNVVIRDRENLPVARACFKEKTCWHKSLVLAVYSPPESLIGSVEESSGICMLSSKFFLRNEDGNNIFRINYQGGFCNNSYFSVTSLDNNNEEVAKILEKTKKTIRLQFLSKMNITNKLILVGFCIGMIHKNNMEQQALLGPT